MLLERRCGRVEGTDSMGIHHSRREFLAWERG